MAPILCTPTSQLSSESNAAQTLHLLQRCSNMEELRQIHGQMLKTGLVLDAIPASKLLAFCASPNSGSLAYARTVFDRIFRPNTFMWNTMIRGYSNSKEPEEALLLYHHMLYHSVPHNAYTFPFLLKACSSMSASEETQQIHAHIIKMGFGSEIYTTNSLLNVYSKSGDIKSARLLFEQVDQRDTVSWNSMIDGYTKCGEIEMAYEIFNHIPERNIISWTSMISGCVGAGKPKEALNLFHRMQTAGIKLDNVALVSTLQACADLGVLDQGKWIHAYIKKHEIEIDPILGCVLIDMYAKCGDLEEAIKVFRKMEEKGVSVWTAMISGYAIHGRGREALEWFMKMQTAGVEPNQMTFTGILTACSHAGLVHEAKLLFESMERIHGFKLSIEHYGCMVDLLGRAGLLKEAEELIENMPVKPNAAIWGALLNACHIHGNLELGKQIGKILIQVDPGHGGRYIHLASIHAAAGEWNQAARVRRQMKEQGVSKLPGCSVISVNGTAHEFLAGDESHPQIKEIDHMLEQIVERLREEGYKPKLGDLLLDLEDKEKETAIHHHSEKLAVTFGLISTKPGMTIRIVKNLRVCEDCHTVIKLISKVYAREILMRDRTRFHLFKDGNCTCGDYW